VVILVMRRQRANELCAIFATQVTSGRNAASHRIECKKEDIRPTS
jgi:hypothetical protein